VAVAPQVGLAVTPGVAIVLLDEGSQGRPRPKVDQGLGRKGEAAAGIAQAEVEHQVLAIVQPFGIAPTAAQAARRKATERDEGAKVAGSISASAGRVVAPSTHSKRIPTQG
jgi:hypothetical protein